MKQIMKAIRAKNFHRAEALIEQLPREKQRQNMRDILACARAKSTAPKPKLAARRERCPDCGGYDCPPTRCTGGYHSTYQPLAERTPEEQEEQRRLQADRKARQDWLAENMPDF